MNSLKIARTAAIGAAALSLLWATGGIAQSSPRTIAATKAPPGAVLGANTVIHPMPAHTAAGNSLKEARPAADPSAPFPGPAPRYEGELEFHGGATIQTATQIQIYITSPGSCLVGATSCWGNPPQFLTDVAGSQFVHLTDQYVGATTGNRYTLGTPLWATFSPQPAVLVDADIQALVHAAATADALPTGYTTIYHVFLPPGMDECFDSTLTTCYSPDIPATFYFCAYHSSTDFADIGHVIYTVEPGQNNYGCNVPPGSPNGALIDSTDSVLSHELIETITDPDGTAWWNSISNSGMYGDEIGDECSFIAFIGPNVYFNPSVFRIGHTTYAIQPEYSNIGESCRTGLGD